MWLSPESASSSSPRGSIQFFDNEPGETRPSQEINYSNITQLNRPGGVVTVSSLWRTRCRLLLFTSTSSSSSCSPRRLPLQQGAVGVIRVQVDEQLVLGARRVAALLAHVQLVAALLVRVLEGDAVDLLHVRLQGAALGEGLLTKGAMLGCDGTCMHRACCLRDKTQGDGTLVTT
ncbi:hypothetical protein INR49_019786, partial [Caranx melampygus]